MNCPHLLQKCARNQNIINDKVPCYELLRFNFWQKWEEKQWLKSLAIWLSQAWLTLVLEYQFWVFQIRKIFGKVFWNWFSFKNIWLGEQIFVWKYQNLVCKLRWAPWNLSCLEFKFDATRLSYWQKKKIGRIEIFFCCFLTLIISKKQKFNSANLILMSIGKSGVIFEFQTT